MTDRNNKYQIVAYAGDMSATGMGFTNKIITVKKRHVDLVNAYLEADEAMDEAYQKHGYECEEVLPAYRTLSDLNDKMFETGVFTIKYDNRSSWAWHSRPMD